jgi:hypothetical protein
MILACIITYNDFPLIKDCVKSVKDKVDKIIAVDGRYRDFPGDSDYSTDGTIEYLSKIDNLQLIFESGVDEVAKRNKYLELVNDGDTILNLDTDEVLVGDIKDLNADFGIIDLHDGHSRHVQKRATRFFKYCEGMAYKNVHYTLYYNGRQVNNLKKVINADFTFDNIKDFYLIHNWHLRSQTRQHNKSIYYKKLLRNEAGFPR